MAAEDSSAACVRPPPEQLIPADYDRRRAPIPADRPLPVQLSVWVLAVTSVNELESEFSVALYLRLKWRDPRVTFPACLRRPFLVIETSELDRLWLPDIYFAASKRATRHSIVRRNALLRLSRANSTLYFSERLSLTLLCSFDFQLFPLDTQVCEMTMEPFAYDAQLMDLRFERPGIYFNNFQFKIPQFKLVHVEPGDCSYTYESQGIKLNQSCLRAAFFFERAFSYYLLQMYVPSVLIVAISFLGFWVPVSQVPGRITLSITTLLTLATQSQVLHSQLPPVSYMKASDVWMFVCVLSVFCTLLEFSLSYRHHERQLGANRTAVGPADVPRGWLKRPLSARRLRRQLGRAARSPHFVDNVSKVAFPVLFALFNVVYWLYYVDSRERKRNSDEMRYMG